MGGAFTPATRGFGSGSLHEDSQSLSQRVAGTTLEITVDADEFHRLDTEFHLALGKLSGNALLPVLMEALRGSMEREMLAGYSRLESWEPVRERLIAEHGQIATAIEAGDADAASRLLEDHILGFYRELVDGAEDAVQA